MWDGPNLFKVLEAEWRSEADGRPARRACARWAGDGSALEGMASPAEVVRCCQARGDGTRSAAMLAAVIGYAGEDRWAARTALQAVLPGLAALSRRARPLVGPSGVWASMEELDQHVVGIACERIVALASEPARTWPANAIVDGTWQRLRSYMAAECRYRGRRVDLGELAEATGGSAASASEELARTLVDAVEEGVLDPVDGWLVFSSRVRGVAIVDLAAESGRNPRWLWRRRVRAEEQLRSAGPVLARLAI
jgi:hypothetical protein